MITYRNPVIAGDFADPSVIRVGDTYYAAGTSSEWGPAYPIYSSKNLVDWEYVGPVFAELPEWTMGSYWAPELFFRNGTFYMYYTARRKSDKQSFIGVASTQDLKKGFKDHGILIEWTKEAIDAFVVEDKGKLFITWKAYGLDKDRGIEILGAELAPDGLKVTGKEFSLIKADAVIDFKDVKYSYSDIWANFMFNFHCISIKKGCNAKLRYGQNDYDFDEGVMTFTSPGQIMSITEADDNKSVPGYWLILHPDFVRNYPLAKMIKDAGFFSYRVAEALHLSEKEETMVKEIMKNIHEEYRSVIDTYSQDVIVSHIELLLNYCNRFYNRQFITRRSASHDILVKLENLLSDYFENEKLLESGLPTVQYVSEQLNLSPNYLSDMLRSLTGQNTQQHIHDKLIEKAKAILTASSLSVSEIAYQLGFEYPQSFNKLFKKKVNVTPLEYRQSFN